MSLKKPLSLYQMPHSQGQPLNASSPLPSRPSPHWPSKSFPRSSYFDTVPDSATIISPSYSSSSSSSSSFTLDDPSLSLVSTSHRKLYYRSRMFRQTDDPYHYSQSNQNCFQYHGQANQHFSSDNGLENYRGDEGGIQCFQSCEVSEVRGDLPNELCKESNEDDRTYQTAAINETGRVASEDEYYHHQGNIMYYTTHDDTIGDRSNDARHVSCDDEENRPEPYFQHPFNQPNCQNNHYQDYNHHQHQYNINSIHNHHHHHSNTDNNRDVNAYDDLAHHQDAHIFESVLSNCNPEPSDESNLDCNGQIPWNGALDEVVDNDFLTDQTDVIIDTRQRTTYYTIEPEPKPHFQHPPKVNILSIHPWAGENNNDGRNGAYHHTMDHCDSDPSCDDSILSDNDKPRSGSTIGVKNRLNNYYCDGGSTYSNHPHFQKKHSPSPSPDPSNLHGTCETCNLESDPDLISEFADVDDCITSSDIVARIENVVQDFLESLALGQLPKLTLISRSERNAAFFYTSGSNTGIGSNFLEDESASFERTGFEAEGVSLTKALKDAARGGGGGGHNRSRKAARGLEGRNRLLIRKGEEGEGGEEGEEGEEGGGALRATEDGEEKGEEKEEEEESQRDLPREAGKRKRGWKDRKREGHVGSLTFTKPSSLSSSSSAYISSSRIPSSSPSPKDPAPLSQSLRLGLGTRTQTRCLLRSAAAGAFGFARVFAVLASVHELHRLRRQATQRDLYYKLLRPPLFRSAGDVSNSIQDAVSILRVPRHLLNVTCCGRGAVAGLIFLREWEGEREGAEDQEQWQEQWQNREQKDMEERGRAEGEEARRWRFEDRSSETNRRMIFPSLPSLPPLSLSSPPSLPPVWVDGRSGGFSGRPLPGDLGQLKRLEVAVHPQASWLLVVEKDAVFHQLCQDRIWEEVPCVLLTAKGMPDLATRAFASMVVRQYPHLTPVGLVDFNPSGILILRTYKFGSLGMGLESHRFALPSLKWLGLRACQLGEVEEGQLHVLSQRDRSLMERLKIWLKAAGEEAWGEELRAMEEVGLKGDIEALYSLEGGYNRLKSVVVEALREGDWV